MIRILAILVIVATALIMFGAAADSMQTVMSIAAGTRG